MHTDESGVEWNIYRCDRHVVEATPTAHTNAHLRATHTVLLVNVYTGMCAIHTLIEPN